MERQGTNKASLRDPVCRFCNTKGNVDLMLAPCSCTEPSFRWAHDNCLLGYVSMYRVERCTICNRRFPVRKKLVPFSRYALHPSTRKDQLYLIGAIVFCTSLYWVLGSAWRYSVFVLETHWMLLAIIYTLLLFQTLCWSIFAFMSIWFYYRMMSEWRERHASFFMSGTEHLERPNREQHIAA
ncbi:E3 ubiquitin-protein ligase MARCHF3-like [Ornithodoros turicata]|uniref:E3 ubiquitin-protein ligase MARCHF3-like n=1 Tax=Ornithodoros turicata TaxID=34597 RepID=UPI0031398DB6